MSTPHSDTKPSAYAQFELEVVINAPRDRVWTALTDRINDWWLPAFHMVGEGSVITFDARAGGQILERLEGGGSLLWGTVQMVMPGHSVHLVGFTAPEWGGPATTMLRFGLEERDRATAVTLTDALVGRVDDGTLTSVREGWIELLEKGLKPFAERS